MRRALNHLQSNVVAYLALFVALGGTSYAAVSLPANSVGNRQIRNHSIDPDKFNPRYIKGNVRLWASVNAAGKVVGGGRGVTVVPPKGVAEAGIFSIEPSAKSSIHVPRRCAAIASVDDRSPQAGVANAEINVAAPGESPRWQVVVETTRIQGDQPTSLPFDVAVVC